MSEAAGLPRILHTASVASLRFPYQHGPQGFSIQFGSFKILTSYQKNIPQTKFFDTVGGVSFMANDDSSVHLVTYESSWC